MKGTALPTFWDSEGTRFSSHSSHLPLDAQGARLWLEIKRQNHRSPVCCHQRNAEKVSWCPCFCPPGHQFYLGAHVLSKRGKMPSIRPRTLAQAPLAGEHGASRINWEMKQRGQGDKHVAEHVGRAKLLLRQCLGQVLGQRLRKNTQHVSRQTRGRNRACQNPGKDIWSGSAQWSPLSAFAKHLGEEEVKFNRSISKVTIDIYNYLLTTSLLNCVAFSHSQLYLYCSHGIWSFKPLKIFCRYNRTILGKITVLRASQQGGRARF